MKRNTGKHGRADQELYQKVVHAMDRLEERLDRLEDRLNLLWDNVIAGLPPHLGHRGPAGLNVMRTKRGQ